MSNKAYAISSHSFYRRPLPDHLTAFSSPEGKKLFKESMEQGYMENYFNLIANYSTQNEPAFCGLGSLTMVLNSLEVDPGRTWKGVWRRWYADEMLECCSPLETVKTNGITFDEFICLAKCNGLNVAAYRPQEKTKEAFLEDVKGICRRSDMHCVVSYSRGTLGQSGDGHFSPIGGYNESTNQVLILDVARFKYPPYWVSLDLLWNSMFPFDLVTSKSRGYFLLSANSSDSPQRFFAWKINTSFSVVVETFRTLRLATDKEQLAINIANTLKELKHARFGVQSVGVDLIGPGLCGEFKDDLSALAKEVLNLPKLSIVKSDIDNLFDYDASIRKLIPEIDYVLLYVLVLSVPLAKPIADFSISPLLSNEISRLRDQLTTGCDLKNTCEKCK